VAIAQQSVGRAVDAKNDARKEVRVELCFIPKSYEPNSPRAGACALRK